MNNVHSIIVLTALLFTTNLHAGQLVLTTTDWSTGNTAVYDTETQVFNGNAMGLDDQDSLVETDGESVYFAHSILGSITKYNVDEIGAGGPVYQYSVGPTSNPQDLVFLEEKAYVIRYGSGSILIIDPNAPDAESFELGTIDLSAFDTDGIPEMTYGFIWDGMVYVVLQRLHNYTSDVPGYVVQIDPETDTIVDLNAQEEGVQGIELLVKNPQSFSQVGSMAYISGHDWAGQTEGVQTFDLNDPVSGQSMLLEEASLGRDVTGVCVINSSLAYYVSNNYVDPGVAYWFDPVTGVVGDQLPVPSPNDGGVLIDGTLYVGSGDYSVPGLYPVNPQTNMLAGDAMHTTLPAYSMVYISDGGTSIVAESDHAPEAFELNAPYPNPFNPAVTIPVTLTADGLIEVFIYNIAGQKVASLQSGELSAGSHNLVWDAGSMAAGTYIVRISHNGAAHSAKVTLLK